MSLRRNATVLALVVVAAAAAAHLSGKAGWVRISTTIRGAPPSPPSASRQSIERALDLPPARRVVDSAAGDLDGDGRDELLIITGGRRQQRGDVLLLARRDRDSVTVAWRTDLSRLNPWRVCIGDVDGDGRREVVLGVWKQARRDPVLANRPFVYEWHGDLVPKWLGSRLSRRFTDLDVGDVDGDGAAELIAVENTIHGTQCLTVYSWKGFGFEGDWNSPEFERIERLRVTDADGGGVAEVEVLGTMHGRRAARTLSLRPEPVLGLELR